MKEEKYEEMEKRMAEKGNKEFKDIGKPDSMKSRIKDMENMPYCPMCGAKKDD